MRKKRKNVVRMAILGEITEASLEQFVQGQDGQNNGFLANDSANTRFEIMLSSPGGDVDAGMAIYEMLRMTKAEVFITGYSIVGSMAVLIFMAGDARILSPGTRVFVHPGTVVSQFPENIFTAAAKAAEMANLHQWYCEEIARRSGHSLVSVLKICAKDTFFSAHEALDIGIATHVELYSDKSC